MTERTLREVYALAYEMVSSGPVSAPYVLLQQDQRRVLLPDAFTLRPC